MQKKILIIGPAHPLRGGGMTTFNHRLAREFSEMGMDCSICSFSLQYPTFLFPGTTQFTDEPAPEGIRIRSLINAINPLNWVKTGRILKKERPDIVIIRYWLPFMGPALGTIARQIRKNKHSFIICIADNILPHEKRFGDKIFTRYFLKACDAFITMSEKVMDDLRIFEKEKPALLARHPLYDNFGAPVSKSQAREHLGLQETDRIILFFGFIRKYKGLDILLEAMSKIPPQQNIKLLVAGEFYGEKEKYLRLIDTLKIRDRLILETDFIPDREVRYYFCAADVIVQPYRNATQSGVTPLAFNYERATIVTNVGGLPALIRAEMTGLVATPDADSIAAAIERFYQLGENHFIDHLRAEKEKYSWKNLTQSLLQLAKDHQNTNLR
ncbi:MAG: glycosyltransferase [Terrimonas sp.]|nr:glycosyltransferase [Terrimonas sp.]